MSRGHTWYSLLTLTPLESCSNLSSTRQYLGAYYLLTVAATFLAALVLAQSSITCCVLCCDSELGTSRCTEAQRYRESSSRLRRTPPTPN